MAIENAPGPARSGKEIVFTLVAVGLLLGAIVFFSGEAHITPGTLEGKEAPEIRFELDKGQASSLSAKRGTVVLLNFWASWCAPCMEEMPSLTMLEQHFASKGFVVLAFNLDEGGDSVRGDLQRDAGKKLPSHLIFNFSKEALGPYRVNAIPQSVLVDKEGIVRKVYAGPVNWMSVDSIREIEAFLK